MDTYSHIPQSHSLHPPALQRTCVLEMGAGRGGLSAVIAGELDDWGYAALYP